VAYPSIYRAKAIQFDGTTLIAYVPQVFGDVTIEITDIIGAVEPGMGWVFFQAGNPEFPVWMSGVSEAAAAGGEEGGGSSIFLTRDYRWLNTTNAADPGHGRVKANNLDPALATTVFISVYDLEDTAYLTLTSLTNGDLLAIYLNGDVGTRIEYTVAGWPALNGGGQWLAIPVSVGANHGFQDGIPGNNAAVKVTIQTTNASTSAGEVYIGPSDPFAANPEVELWYDTDATSTEVTPWWNTAWGYLGSTGFSNLTTSGTTPLVVRTLTVTLAADRRYRVNISQSASYGSVAADVFTVDLLLDGAVIAEGNRAWTIDVAGNYLPPSKNEAILTTSPSAGSHTFTIRVTRGTGTGTLQARFALSIEDVGPMAGAPLTMTIPPPPWTTLPLINNWTAVAGNVPNQYRKVGDMVQVRGYIAHLTAPTPSGGVQIAMLPAQHTPPYLTPVTVGYQAAGQSYAVTTLNVMPDGGILYYGSTLAISYMIWDFDFSVTP
jgi:hypothetical protein